MPKKIIAEYRNQSEWDIQELWDSKQLKQHPDNIDYLYVKYDYLNIYFKNGTEQEIEGQSSEWDYKYPNNLETEE